MRINSENKSVDMEVRDINYILPAYIRSYLFYNKNELPEKIIFPMFPSVKVGGKDIPIEWVPPLEEIAVEIAQDGADVPEVTEEQEAVIDEKDKETKRLRAEAEALTATGRGEEGMGGTPESETPLIEVVQKNINEVQQEDEVGGTQETKEITTSEQLLDEAADLQFEEDTEPVVEGLTEEEQTYEAARADQPEVLVIPSPEDLTRQQEETAIPEEKSPDVPAARAAFADIKPEKLVPSERIPKQPPGGDIGPGQGLSDTHPRDTRDQTRTARDLKEEPDIREEEEKPFEKEVKRDDKGNPIVEDKPNVAD